MNSPRSNYLVYTSAGDNSNIHYWLKNFNGQKVEKSFDLWVTYYGNQRNKYKEISDFYNMRRGGKFQNLLYVYQQWKEILDNYEAIFILDDDIIIDCNAINRLFEIREQFDLWLLQPAFDPRGKISHPITKVNRSCFMRYTNFVENTCPLFRKDKLAGFMKIFDPVLTGWGIDLWYHFFLGEHPRKIAIIDAIPCINPHDTWKGGQREIERLEKTSESINKWSEIRERLNIKFDGEGGKFRIKQFGCVKKQG